MYRKCKRKEEERIGLTFIIAFFMGKLSISSVMFNNFNKIKKNCLNMLLTDFDRLYAQYIRVVIDIRIIIYNMFY